ncbi:hypothetical protein RL72_00307 [Microbacterium azadirachtae]|uniref:Uncharacterized protein n=1 Tax=Microbacterium azadirachtae TaxID=582680 RepID=A0A0F0L917_9MICO|nr:hypothetical protein RL72_00307 [Microbacterium azadirachtae]
MPPPVDGAPVGAGGLPPPEGTSPPSRIFFGDAPLPPPVGTGTGRFIADFASCSADIAWYMSNPTKEMNLYVMYGANAATSMRTTPAIGSLMEARSRSIGWETWAMATRNTTTRTSLDRIRASTKVAHLPNQPRVASHDAPARATGANTIATSRRALRTSRENHTIAAAEIARPAKKMVMIAPTPGAAMLMPASAPPSRAILSPMSCMELPVAWTMPMHSWSVISSSVPVRVRATKEPSTDFASPRAARGRAPGSRRIRPVMSWRQKKTSITKIATPNRRL